MEPFIALILIALLGMAMPILLVLGALAIDLVTVIYVAITVARNRPRPPVIPRSHSRIRLIAWHRVGVANSGF